MPARVAKLRKGDALQAGCDSELATMMEVVGHDAPENPLTRERVVFPLRIWHQAGGL